MYQLAKTSVMLLLVACALSTPLVDVLRPSETEREDSSKGSRRPSLPEGNSEENEVGVSPERPGEITPRPPTQEPESNNGRFPVVNLFPGTFPSLFGDDDDFGDGIFLNFNPFNSFSMQNAFKRLENMMRQAEERIRHMFQDSFNVTSQLPEEYDNSTSDIIEINGQKYKLERTINKKGNNESSVFVSFTTLTPVNRRKRSVEALTINSFANELHRLKREASYNED